MNARQTALEFVEQINRHDVPGILSLMAPGHVFIDAYGHEETAQQMQEGWPGYFEWFPNYKIEIEQVLEEGDTVALFGYAGGSYRGSSDARALWRLPAVWRVKVEEERVKVWQVYCDTKLPYECMEQG